MSKATSTATSSLTTLTPSSATATPVFQRPVEDIELDDHLDDHELSDDSSSEQQQLETRNMGSRYRNEDSSSGPSGVKKMGEVANAISSCVALSFFSISMILANKVRVCTLFCSQKSCVL